MRLLTRPLGRLLAAGVLLVVLFGGWFYSADHPFGAPGAHVIVNVRDGESLSALGSVLEKDKVISSSLAFRIDTTVFGSFTVQPGTYVIRENSSFSTVRSVFSSAPNATEIVVDTGNALFEIDSDVANALGVTFANRFVAAQATLASHSAFAPDDGSLEGLVAPGTYVVRPGESAVALATTMYDRFVHNAAKAGITPTGTYNGLTAYQTVIGASIVVKEGYYGFNFSRVARVILNRLHRGGGLQMDSTILYSYHMDGGTVTPAMLQHDTPYNTYLHAGLTPTPICAVSISALRAMVHPAKGRWLYFTLINRDGQLAFANTFAEQLVNERLAAQLGIG